MINLMILHMLERLTVCINYLLSPEMMFNKNEMSIPDIWVACQQIMNMMDQLNAIDTEGAIKIVAGTARSMGVEVVD